MNDDHGFERAAAEWLDTGSDATPPQVIDAVLLAASVTPQERDLRIPWRTSTMTAYLRIAAVIAVVAALGVVASVTLKPETGIGFGPTATPTSKPTAEPTPTPAPTPDPLDTTTWESYSSSQYRFTIAHPADWEIRPAERAWDPERDASDWLSPAMDNFINPGGNVRVSVWSVALQADVYADNSNWGIALAAWIEDYCQKTGSTSCDGILEGAVPLCREVWDCHPGMLVGVAEPFDREVQAFFSGPDNNEITVVTVWRGQTDPSVDPYGGGKSLVEAFLSTMDVWTAEEAEIQRNDASP